MDKYKIAVVTNNKINLSKHFGKSKYFAVYEINGNEISEPYYIDFPDNEAHNPKKQRLSIGIIDGGSVNRDHHDVLLSLIKDCKVVLSGGMGEGMKEKLLKYDFTAILTAERDIKNAVQSYVNGTLINQDDLIH